MRDCYYERDTVFGDFDRIRDITQIDLVGHEKHQAYRLSSIQEEIGLLSDTSRRTSIREKFRRSNFKEQQENSGNKTKRKMEYWSTIPRVMMMTFHLWSERLIFTPEEVPASEELFASTAELCSVNFSLSSLLWNYGIA